jgi:DNA-binding response OmpR family regulator
VTEADVRPVVLVVDDEPMIRDVLQQFLAREGFEVLTASNGTQALALCRSEPGRVALAVLDVRLPGLDGGGQRLRRGGRGRLRPGRPMGP